MSAPRYTLRLSIRALGKAPIDGLESEPTLDIGSVCVKVKQRGRYLIFQAGDFSSESEAEAFLPKLKGGLWNLALEHNIAFAPYFERRDITRPEDPFAAARHLAKSFGVSIEEPLKPVHGLTEDEGYTIYRTEENIRFIGFGGGTASVSSGWDQVSRSLSTGIENVRLNILGFDGHLVTAIDLYLSSFYESSMRARFLTLMMVLEVLAPVTERHASAVRLLTDLQSAIGAQLANEPNEDARDALESLWRESEFRKETSIRQRVRRLVLDKVPLDSAARVALARKVVQAYDLRGALVHTGVVDPRALDVATDTALQTVKLLLRGLLGLAEVPAQ